MKRLAITTADTVQFSKIVRGLNFFGSMNMAMLERILDGIQLFEWDRGEKVCVQGEVGDTFFVVQQGSLAVSVRKGKLSLSKKIATLGPGDCFGEMALLHEAPRNATVACTSASRVFVLPASHFKAVLKQNPEFAKEINDLANARQFELDQKAKLG
ncbi:MAG: cyclic nucleotide-binding domain-containing protein [Geothrix sp.]|nr:cyclic nucleotide-binding domain-containing protein [Geothrix sp.]